MSLPHAYAAVIDFETTGLDTENDQPLEFAALVFDPIENLYIKTFEGFFTSGYGVVPKEKRAEIEKLTGIMPDFPVIFGDQCDQFKSFVSHVGVTITHLIAHNAPFDRAFFDRECLRLCGKIPEVTWIDTTCDVEFRDGIQSKSLKYLAADHGILSHSAHRAFADCQTLFQIVKQYDFQEILAYAAVPTVELIAAVSFHDKDKAKEKGFRWDDKRKVWFMKRKKTYTDVAELGYDFPVKE